jgi:hypothetical protein
LSCITQLSLLQSRNTEFLQATISETGNIDEDSEHTLSNRVAYPPHWPPLIASGKMQAGIAVKARLLGRTTRRDGRRQVTYNGHPLYTFLLDARAARRTARGLDLFGAEWYAVSPAGAKVEKQGEMNGVRAGRAPAATADARHLASRVSSPASVAELDDTTKETKT